MHLRDLPAATASHFYKLSATVKCDLVLQRQAKLMSMFLPNRLINTAATFTLALNVVGGAGNPACDILEIAVDGIYLSRGRKHRLGRSFLSQSARMGLLIFYNKPGEYYVSLHIGFGFLKHLYLLQNSIDSFSRPTIVKLF